MPFPFDIESYGAPFQVREVKSNGWALGLTGVLPLLFGILVVVWLMATYATLYGIIVLTLAFRVRHTAPGWPPNTG